MKMKTKTRPRRSSSSEAFNNYCGSYLTRAEEEEEAMMHRGEEDNCNFIDDILAFRPLFRQRTKDKSGEIMFRAEQRIFRVQRAGEAESQKLCFR